MTSPLFAFRVARPIEITDVTVEYSYDPRSQTLIWGGDGAAAAAARCTRISRGGYSSCSNYRDHPGCFPSGGINPYGVSYKCD